MSGKHHAPPQPDCTPETHGARGNRVWDVDFSSWRCRGCGHRVETGGKKPKATRFMWPTRWPRELARREWARTVIMPPQREEPS